MSKRHTMTGMFHFIPGPAIFLLMIFAICFTANAATCPAGYYLKNNECIICTETSGSRYYCPGDDLQHTCPTDTLIADSMADIVGTIVSFSAYTWARDIHTLQPSDFDQVTDCTGQVNGKTDTASYTWLGSHNGTRYVKGWLAYTACVPGYYLSDLYYDKYYWNLNRCSNLPTNAHWVTPSDNDYTKCAWECDTGYGRHNDGCAPLCSLGGTKLHAGGYSFNVWANGSCSSPSIKIGFSGGTCCVNLEPGSANGAIHVNYNGNTYHTVN